MSAAARTCGHPWRMAGGFWGSGGFKNAVKDWGLPRGHRSAGPQSYYSSFRPVFWGQRQKLERPTLLAFARGLAPGCEEAEAVSGCMASTATTGQQHKCTDPPPTGAGPQGSAQILRTAYLGQAGARDWRIPQGGVTTSRLSSLTPLSAPARCDACPLPPDK